ncbi:thioesterase II family protein [Allokutzneria oryzae]|uniref:Thioesterase II family protein n=1 Tax=Allokutzneria oryzae TaxID=1378989 RepID=A0ABV5ZQK6_9PSEU
MNDRWIRRFRPCDPGAPRLVCLPHAGGTASGFYWLSVALAPHVEVLAVQYPGRQDRLGEPVVEDVPTLADELHRALEPWQNQPPALFGHSMGALVAFELARRFPVRHLVASAQVSPSRVAEVVRLSELPEDEFVAEVEALGGFDPQVMADPELRSLVLPALRGDYKANEDYRCPPETTVDTPVTVILGDADPDVTPEEARLWQQHTRASFDLRVFEGGHFFLEQHQDEVRDLLLRLLT